MLPRLSTSDAERPLGLDTDCRHWLILLANCFISGGYAALMSGEPMAHRDCQSFFCGYAANWRHSRRIMGDTFAGKAKPFRTSERQSRRTRTMIEFTSSIISCLRYPSFSLLSFLVRSEGALLDQALRKLSLVRCQYIIGANTTEDVL